jgi:hydroxypyruvate isomerase
MLKFCANIGMLFPEVPFLERFAACRSSGFRYVEFPFPYAYKTDLIAGLIRDNRLELVVFDLPVDDWDTGVRGCATDPDAVQSFRESLERAVEYASALRPHHLTCIVGKKVPGIAYSDQWKILVDNLQYAADRIRSMAMNLLVEVFNDHDNPGFFLTRLSDADALVETVNRPNFFIQMDTYHTQIMEGNVTSRLRQYVARIGHVQIGDVPGRHQPGTGSIDFPFFFNTLDRLGYRGWLGLEYIPLGDTRETLDWLHHVDVEWER